jgi:HEAT repeat protein
LRFRPDLLLATLGVAFLFNMATVGAQPSTTAERLIREEQVRESVEDAFDLMALASPDGGIRNDNLVRAVDQVVAIGPEAIPYLIVELEQGQPDTYFFSVYSLGRLGTEASEKALREAAAKADKLPGDWAALQKAWCCWALGLMGIAEAIDLVMDGQHASGHTPIHGNFTVLESIAVQTAPQSLTHLRKQWEEFDSDSDPRYSERVTMLKAIGHVPGPESREILIRALREEHPLLARQAAYGLGEDDSPEALAALLAALDTSDVRVRRGVALALNELPVVEPLDLPVARLEEEDNAIVRGALYRVIARFGGAQYTDSLLEQWGREDPVDRMQLVQVLPGLDPKKVLPVLEQALRDPASQVSVAAATALADVGSPDAIERLIDSLWSPFWTVASSCIDQLVRIDETRATAPIAKRLIESELNVVVVDPRRRMQIEKLGDALVALGGTDRMDELREAASRQKDGFLVEYLDRQIKRLQTLLDNGKKTKRWLEALTSSDPDVRMLAYDFFGRHGNAKTARTLVDMFGRVEPEEGLAILRAVGHVDCEASQELIERILTAPEFDSYERAALRDLAAWNARRFGGEAMRDLLEESIVRRDGRDTRPLVYFSILAGADAVPFLERYRARRMAYITWKRGDEMKKLDWIRRELVHGGSLAPVDLPPRELNF